MSIHSTTVSPKTTTALRLDNELLAVMRRVKATEGIPLTTQIEMAVRDWLDKKGFAAKTANRRASTRRKA